MLFALCFFFYKLFQQDDTDGERGFEVYSGGYVP